MPTFSRLIRFQAADSNEIFFADLGSDTVNPPPSGSKIEAHKSFDELTSGQNAVSVTLGKARSLDTIFAAFANQMTAACSAASPWSANILCWHELQNTR
jgi:hypothetical protein